MIQGNVYVYSIVLCTPDACTVHVSLPHHPGSLLAKVGFKIIISKDNQTDFQNDATHLYVLHVCT